MSVITDAAAVADDWTPREYELFVTWVSCLSAGREMIAGYDAYIRQLRRERLAAALLSPDDYRRLV